MIDVETETTKSPRRRTRTISVRVSEREFELLKTKSEAEGARSISDFARLALCGTGSTGVPAERVDQGIDRLGGEMQQLSAEVRRVMELLESSRPAGHEQVSVATRKTRGASS